jgi:hypothetical protein
MCQIRANVTISTRYSRRSGGSWKAASKVAVGRGCFPQLWVSSGAVAGHLDTLADRLRYNRQNTRVRRFGELLSYATGRYPIAGQQALLTATAALRLHWASGQQPAEDEHLGALLAWVDPPVGIPIQEAVAAAERVPMGVKTDPEFDRTVLDPLVETYDRTARGPGASRRSAADAAMRIQQALEPVALRIYDATQRAVQLLIASGLPELPGLAELEALEAAEFESFMQARDDGRPITLRDRPRAAAFGLSTRESARKCRGGYRPGRSRRSSTRSPHGQGRGGHCREPSPGANRAAHVRGSLRAA